MARAERLLAELEAGREERPASAANGAHAAQPPLLALPSPLECELAGLEVEAMTPLAAIAKLDELRSRAREAGAR